jgi:hypothetical protein
MRRHPATLRTFVSETAPDFTTGHRSGKPTSRRLTVVSDAARPVRPRLRVWLARAFRSIARAQPWGGSSRLPVLRVERLSEHLKRDLGLTHHVEQPTPPRR